MDVHGISYGVYIDILKISYGYPMDFLWNSNGGPIDLQFISFPFFIFRFICSEKVLSNHVRKYDYAYLNCLASAFPTLFKFSLKRLAFSFNK